VLAALAHAAALRGVLTAALLRVAATLLLAALAHSATLLAARAELRSALLSRAFSHIQ
jgi:hypothetical protein